MFNLSIVSQNSPSVISNNYPFSLPQLPLLLIMDI
jgi:hypothetical protein